MNGPKLRAILPWLVLAALGLASCALQARRVLDQPPLANFDGHLARAANVAAFLGTGDPFFLARHGEPVAFDRVPSPDRYPYYSAYPPLSHAWTALSFRLGGPDPRAARLAQLAWIGPLLLGVGLLGARLGGPWAAPAAGSLVLLAPIVAHTSTLVTPDLPAAAASALLLGVALQPDPFARPRLPLLLGLLLGLALLVKWSVAYTALPPLLVLGLVALRRDRAGPRHLVAMALLGLGPPAALLALQPWNPSPAAWAPWIPPLILLLVVLPASLALYIGQKTHFIRVRGVLRTLGLGLLLAGPWYVAFSGDLLANLRVNQAHFEPPPLGAELGIAVQILRDLFPLALPLGLLGLVLTRQRRPALLLLASAGGLLALLLASGNPQNFLHLGEIQTRLLCAIPALLAPLAGAGLTSMPRVGPALALLVSGLGAALAGCSVYLPGPAARLATFLGPTATYWAAPPAPQHGPSELPPSPELLALLASLERGPRDETVYIVASNTLRHEFNVEATYLQALLRAGKVVAFDRLSPGVNQGRYDAMFAAQRERLAHLDYILLIGPPFGEPPTRLLDELRQAWPPGGEVVTSALVHPELRATAIALHPEP